MLGVIAVQNKREAENPMKRAAQAISQNREAVTRVAQSGDARRLMELLGQEGGVQQAAQAAAAGDPSQLMAMMNQLMHTSEGAELVERIQNEAKKAGLQ